MSVIFIGIMATIASVTGTRYVLFPVLAALAYEVFQRPCGPSARAQIALIATPVAAAIAGVIVTRNVDYGITPVLLIGGIVLAVILLFRSAVLPSFSVGLLPLTLGLHDWLYVGAVLLGTVLLSAMARIRNQLFSGSAIPPSAPVETEDIRTVFLANYHGAIFFAAVAVALMAAVHATGWRLVLFPPLVVIGFEMFVRRANCPWASRPLLIPVLCLTMSISGVVLVNLMGSGPPAAMSVMALGGLLLRLLDLHFPPVLAVGLLPFVTSHHGASIPLAITLGAFLLTASFLVWERLQTAFSVRRRPRGRRYDDR